MEQIGYVRRTFDDMAEVEVRRISGCGGGCSSCGGGCNTPSVVVSLKNSVDAKAGDYVEIKGEPNHIIKYALILYMIPFAMLVIGIVSGMALFKSRDMANYESYGFLSGLVFLIISFLIVKKIDSSIQKKDEKPLEMVKILY
ncbi:MAG: SoxR reducing system RseC family protein [Tissierellia bacterium]|nr:SoxR reducing system RseC family protein [Tissierellia bacterium]